MQWLMEIISFKNAKMLKEKLLYQFRNELKDFNYYPENNRWRFNKRIVKE